MNKLDLFRKLYEHHAKGNAWLDTVPNEINESFFDNPYVGSLRRQLDLVQAAVFTEDQLSDIDWFLFDWSVTPTLTWKIDDIEYSFSDIEEYIWFLQTHRSEVWVVETKAEAQPEMKEYPDGTRQWWLNGKLHRTDGPAIEWADGTRQWWLNGELHRTDGPAIEWSNGTRAWYLNDEEYSFEYWCRRTNKTEEEISKLEEQYFKE